MPAPILTLMTDFGLKDGNVGVMKGVILKIAPQVQLVDVSHLIAPQNIMEAGLILSRGIPYFPPGTIHIVVVDPGVGTARRPMAAQLGDQYFVGPDNGLITLWLESVTGQGAHTRFIHLNRAEFWLPEVSHVFHGRDIFAPSAAHLAAGAPLEALGQPFDDPVRLPLPRPQRNSLGWETQVIHVDYFGNLATALRRSDLAGQEVHSLEVAGRFIPSLQNTFGESAPGELIALFGSTGNLVISVVNGSAAQALNAGVGQRVQVNIRDAHAA